MYGLLNCIYVSSGGHNEKGDPYIYEALDWNDDFGGTARLMIVFMFIGGPIIYFLNASVNHTFDWCHSKFLPKPLHSIPDVVIDPEDLTTNEMANSGGGTVTQIRIISQPTKSRASASACLTF